ncbi:MAG: globin domain-containing protein [Pseudomonadota bacterium]
MQLDQHEIDLIRRTHDDLCDRLDGVSEQFYHNLFARAPGLRAMFRSDLGDQGMRFMTAIGTVVNYLDSPERLADRLQDLGEGHAALGVSRLHYDPMRDALLQTFHDTLGPAWSDDAEAAWRHAFDQVADRMASISEQTARSA